jgi:hypothetical protein
MRPQVRRKWNSLRKRTTISSKCLVCLFIYMYSYLCCFLLPKSDAMRVVRNKVQHSHHTETINRHSPRFPRFSSSSLAHPLSARGRTILFVIFIWKVLKSPENGSRRCSNEKNKDQHWHQQTLCRRPTNQGLVPSSHQTENEPKRDTWLRRKHSIRQ